MQSPDVQRITHILDYCQRIENTVSRYGRDAAVFESDMDYQQSIAFSILQIGELCGALSLEYRTATEHQIPWGSIKGMRNFVVHNYGKVSREMLWETVLRDIPALKAFCEKVLSEELSQGEQSEDGVLQGPKMSF